ncbi:MAG: hypothetical protein IJU76_12040 [Desulfovibrionaceae bacterium]|nr:hypothetical protein [Desulfovibrionaceae bacterium]
MGDIDNQTLDYMANKYRFADAFNFYMHGGKNVVDPDSLSQMDTTLVALPYGVNAKATVQKHRDLVKLCTAIYQERTVLVVMGLELQTLVHYAMPVRAMLYDAMSYTQQVKEAEASYAKNRVLQPGGEYLSKFRKTDRLMPVITLTLCLSDEVWDGPTSIHEMLTVEDEQWLKYVPNYTINLLTPAEIAEEDFGKFRTGLGPLLKFIKHRKDNTLDWMGGTDLFKRVDWDTGKLINSLAGGDLELKKEGDSVNMWVALENKVKQARDEAFKEGYQEGLAGVARAEKTAREKTKVADIQYIMDSFGVDAQKAMDALRVPIQEQENYAKLILSSSL